MLDDKINSRFKFARFKLFETNINGGITEVCETTYKGVPYSGGLNNGARILVGLDIINTLSEYYNFSAPIFIDNAEAVTEEIKANGQIIKLVVSEQDKKIKSGGGLKWKKYTALLKVFRHRRNFVRIKSYPILLQIPGVAGDVIKTSMNLLITKEKTGKQGR